MNGKTGYSAWSSGFACVALTFGRWGTMAVVAILCAPLASGPALAQDLATYAKICDKEVGASVSAFDCVENGFDIDMQGTAGGDCPKPPYLHKTECRKGSKLGVQPNTGNDIAIVWLCRKKKVTNPGSKIFDDVAVIQTNFVNGATCFYQKLGDTKNSEIPAPSEFGADEFWMTPVEAAEQECASCHDAGLLRTPYLTQVKNKIGEKVMPKDLRKTKYWFPGDAFDSWNGKVYRVVNTDEKKQYCTSCHQMGGNEIEDTLGTSTWLGLMATGVTETPHLTPDPESGQHAFWMKPIPPRTKPNKDDMREAERMRDCALGEIVPDCRREPWGGKTEAVIEPSKEQVSPKPKSPEGKNSAEHDNK